jgi:hypothetical protein
VKANLTAINQSVFAADGSRLPPDFPAWVDDAFAANVLEYFILTVCSSVLALFLALGMPAPALEPNPLSLEKLNLLSNHKRKYCGVNVDSRTMMVSMVPYKRALLLTKLQRWTVPPAQFTLKEFAQVTGLLVDHSKICRWGRLYVYNIFNQLRFLLLARYHLVIRKATRKGIVTAVRKAIPEAVGKRLDQLVARGIATILWHARGQYTVSTQTCSDFQFLFDYLAAPANPWHISIGHIIPREPFGESYGDALTEGGVVLHTHRFRCAMAWSPEMIRRTYMVRHDHDSQVHISQLEMVICNLWQSWWQWQTRVSLPFLLQPNGMMNLRRLSGWSMWTT